MRIRTFLTALGLSSVFALTGCASTATKTTPATPASAPAFVETTQIFGDEVYGATTDAGYALPAIPINKVDKRFHRQIVAYETPEKPGTVIVNTRERFLYYILPGGKAVRYGLVKPMLRGSRNGQCGIRQRKWLTASRKSLAMWKLVWARA